LKVPGPIPGGVCHESVGCKLNEDGFEDDEFEDEVMFEFEDEVMFE